MIPTDQGRAIQRQIFQPAGAVVAVPEGLALLPLGALREGADSRRANSVGDEVYLRALIFDHCVRVSVFFMIGL